MNRGYDGNAGIHAGQKPVHIVFISDLITEDQIRRKSPKCLEHCFPFRVAAEDITAVSQMVLHRPAAYSGNLSPFVNHRDLIKTP